jgi:hypothetical protein
LHALSLDYLDFIKETMDCMINESKVKLIGCSNQIWQYFELSPDFSIIMNKLNAVKDEAEKIVANQRSMLLKMIHEGLENEFDLKKLREYQTYLELFPEEKNRAMISTISKRIWNECLKKSKLNVLEMMNEQIRCLFQVYQLLSLPKFVPYYLKVGEEIPDMSKFYENNMRLSRAEIIKHLFDSNLVDSIDIY